jgi:nitric oxide dioxygenase
MNEEKKTIIKQTVPVLEEHGETITKLMYQNMFQQHPELLNMFNQTNQKVGDQPKALANTVLAAAKHVDHLEALTPAVLGIANKHRALNVKPEHYPIVGENLLGAIQEVLGDDASPEIIDAWGEYYGELAQVFIDIEDDMYETSAWEGFQPFKVTAKDQMSEDIVRFTADNKNLPLDFKAGQYITVKVKPEDYPNEALRHYSICSIDTTNGIQFAVKREGVNETSGVVSHYMHDDVNVGDTIELSAPAGDFTMNPAHEKVLFVAGGVGATPIMAMAEEAIDRGLDAKLLYSAYDEAHQPFKEEMEKLKDDIDVHVKLTNQEGVLVREDFAGYEDREVYICGSMHFMEAMTQVLKEVGFNDKQIHFEPFGPKMSLAS